jgi:hypothetical protein
MRQEMSGPMDCDPLLLAGYAPCPWPSGDVATRECQESAWPVAAEWIGPGRILVTYGPAACGHTAEATFIVLVPDQVIPDAAE